MSSIILNPMWWDLVLRQKKPTNFTRNFTHKFVAKYSLSTNVLIVQERISRWRDASKFTRSRSRLYLEVISCKLSSFTEGRDFDGEPQILTFIIILCMWVFFFISVSLTFFSVVFYENQLYRYLFVGPIL